MYTIRWCQQCANIKLSMHIVHVAQGNVQCRTCFFFVCFTSEQECFVEFLHCSLILICLVVGILRSLRAAELKYGQIMNPHVKAWACRDLGLTTDPAEEAGATTARVVGDPLIGCDVEDMVEVRPASFASVPQFCALAILFLYIYIYIYFFFTCVFNRSVRWTL